MRGGWRFNYWRPGPLLAVLSIGFVQPKRSSLQRCFWLSRWLTSLSRFLRLSASLSTSSNILLYPQSCQGVFSPHELPQPQDSDQSDVCWSDNRPPVEQFTNDKWVGSGSPRHMCDTVWNPDTTLRLLSTFSLQSWWSSFSCLPCMLQYLNKKCFQIHCFQRWQTKHKPQTKQSKPVSCQCCQHPPSLKCSLQIEPGVWDGKPK